MLLRREYLLLEPARVHRTRKNERYTGIITRPIFGWKCYQKIGSEDKKPNLDRYDSLEREKKERKLLG